MKQQNILYSITPLMAGANTKMKKSILIIVLLIGRLTAYACPACEKQQPKILKGITHGAGPESNWDYVIVWATVLIVIITFFYAVKWMIRPGESNYDHIKRTVLN